MPIIEDLRPIPVSLLAHVLVLVVECTPQRRLPGAELIARHGRQLGPKVIKHPLDIVVNDIRGLLVPLHEDPELQDVDLLSHKTEDHIAQLLLGAQGIIHGVRNHLPEEEEPDPVGDVRYAVLVGIHGGMVHVARDGVLHAELHRLGGHHHPRPLPAPLGQEPARQALDATGHLLGQARGGGPLDVAHDEQPRPQALAALRRKVRAECRLVESPQRRQDLRPAEGCVHSERAELFHGELVGHPARGVRKAVDDLAVCSRKLLGPKLRPQQTVERLQQQSPGVLAVAACLELVATTARLHLKVQAAIPQVLRGLLQHLPGELRMQLLQRY
mmetsp:Transcript_83375/g.231395  ORF Transcript_83375/g.231395 Transcript_83375/m.231395 type:complete len:329 (-) Transcript_83375:11-997(-)